MHVQLPPSSAVVCTHQTTTPARPLAVVCCSLAVITDTWSCNNHHCTTRTTGIIALHVTVVSQGWAIVRIIISLLLNISHFLHWLLVGEHPPDPSVRCNERWKMEWLGNCELLGFVYFNQLYYYYYYVECNHQKMFFPRNNLQNNKINVTISPRRFTELDDSKNYFVYEWFLFPFVSFGIIVGVSNGGAPISTHLSLWPFKQTLN